MVWLSLTSQKSGRIKILLEIDFFLSEAKVEILAVFQFTQYFVEFGKESF